MATKTRMPLVVGVAALVLVGGGLYATSTATRPEDRRVVKFRAHWNPTYVKSGLIQMGPVGHLEQWRGEKPTFDKTRNMDKGDTAVLEVQLPENEAITNFSCSIKVGAEAPKFAVVEGHYCRVDKYVS